MSDYTFYKNLKGYAGDARVYTHDYGGRTVMVSRVNTFDRGDETMIFAYDLKANRVASWMDLYAGYGVTHAQALEEYESQ